MTTQDVETSVSYYQRIGGGPAVKEAVERFYARVTADPDLRQYFTNVDMSRLKRHQALLISQVLGGPAAYDGRDLATAHSGMGITDAQFDKVAHHLVAALTELGVEQPIVDFAANAVLSLRPQVVAGETG